MFVDEKFRQFGDPVLRMKCQAFDDFNGDAVRLGRNLLDRLQRSDLGIGLAANQIGIQRRAFAYDLSYYEPNIEGVLFNPEIIDSDGVATYEEGCLSIPNFYYPVERPDVVLVRGVNLDGNIVEYELEEIAARLFQHEIDHLDGLLIFDRLEPDERKKALVLANDVAGEQRVRGRRSRRLSL